MCKVCNLFSPSKAKLLAHVSEKHSLDGLDSDDIIVPLRPLAASQAEKSGGERSPWIRTKTETSFGII